MMRRRDMPPPEGGHAKDRRREFERQRGLPDKGRQLDLERERGADEEEKEGSKPRKGRSRRDPGT